MRYVTWKIGNLADPLPVLHQEMEKCLNLLILHRHSSEYNGLKKMFLEPQNH